MKKSLTVLKNTVNIGLEKPVKLLHITDTHICMDDDGTPSKRSSCFNVDYEDCSKVYFEMALQYAKDNDLLIVHTGDMFDFLSQKNLKYVQKKMQNIDYVYAAGNHDFVALAADMGRVIEDEAYKMRNMEKSAPCFSNNLHFFSRIVDGVNIVALDNSYYQIEPDQLRMLKYEVARGYPVVLCMHVPLYTEKLVNIVMGDGGRCGFCCGGSDEYLTKNYLGKQRPNEDTICAIDYITNEPMIKLVIAGHIHNNVEDVIEGRLPQLATHGSFAGYVREITLV